MLNFLFEYNREYKQYATENEVQDGTSRRATVIIDRTEDCKTNTELEPSPRDDSMYSTFGSSVEEGLDAELKNCFISPSSLLMQQTQPNVDVLVRKSNSYVPSRHWAMLFGCFHHFFQVAVEGQMTIDHVDFLLNHGFDGVSRLMAIGLNLITHFVSRV